MKTSLTDPIRERRLLAVLVILAFAIRLGLAIHLGLNTAPRLGSDQSEYDTYAWNVAQGNGYRGMSPDVADQDHLTAYRPPLPSVEWAVLYEVFGHRYAAVRISQCFLDAVSVWLTWAVGRRCFGPSVGLLSAAAYAMYPMALLSAIDLVSEPLATFLLLCIVLAYLRFVERPSWLRAGVAGIALGLELLCRANTVFLVPLVIVWAAWQLRPSWKAFARSLTIPAIAALAMVPWIVRNYSVFHAFVPFSTMGGSVLLQGNNRIVATDPDLYGSSIWDTKIPEYADELHSATGELDRDQRAKRLAVTWIKSNIAILPKMILNKLIRGMTPFLQLHTPRLDRIGMLVSWGPVLLLSAISFFPTLWISLRTRGPQWLLHLVIAHFLINTVVFFGLARYREPIDPYFLILASVTVITVFKWIATKCNPQAVRAVDTVSTN